MVKAAFGVLAVLAAAWFFLPHHKSPYHGPRGRVEDPSLTEPASYLKKMPPVFERHRESNHTYGGMVLSGADARVVYANETSYCLEAGDYYLLGPGGAPVQGKCPR
jgi:hypothetical protein